MKEGKRLVFPGLRNCGFRAPGNQPEIEREREKEREKDTGTQVSGGARVLY